VRLRIEGIGCDGCVAAVDEGLRRLPGVWRVTIDLGTDVADVDLEQPADTAPLLVAVDQVGYGAAIAA
jgi:Au+-exporting ATPase